jgi:hypothetical protein
MQRNRLPYILIPITALIAVLPLLLYGCSCGHDFDFHLLSWMEAARQFTHGNLHPHWAYTPAYNAGEPRFVFYPPLSWTLGAILGLALPWTWTPIVYTWLALTASGLALHRLARDFTTAPASLIAAVLYTVNPYMLFTAYERTAYAELLAAAWIPLLLHAILRGDSEGRVTIPRIAIPTALLWITNAPAAVMSCYALALLTLIRLATNPRANKNPGAPYLESEIGASRPSAIVLPHSCTTTQSPFQLARNTIAGTILGLALAAFYIVPAAYERRFVQIAMAILPGMRIQDNFLFHHTADADHDQVLHTASLIAIILIASIAITLAIAYLQRRHTLEKKSPLPALAILTAIILLLLTPLTAIFWSHAPELAFLQFPWRFLAILAAALGLAVALALAPLKLKPAATTTIALTLAAILTYPAYTVFHQTCDEEDTVQARLALFRSNLGAEPTDEYTPTTADNDSLAHTNPPYWLAPTTDAKAPANAAPGPAPMHLALNSPIPQTLILNLRDYPAWHITLNGAAIPQRDQRDDGLIALPIPTGPSTIAITYTHSLDQTIGDTISIAALLVLFLTTRKKRPVLPDGPTARGAITS